MSAYTAMKRCAKCGRRARWLWLGSNYEAPKFVCGHHKRAYVTVILWEEAEKAAVDAQRSEPG